MFIYIVLIMQQVLAASTHVVGKSLTSLIDPTLSLLIRAAIASVVFGGWIIYTRKSLPKLNKKDTWLFLLLGFLCVPMNQLLFFVSVKYTTAPNVALAYALVPTFVFLLEIFHLKMKISKLKLIGIVLAFLGTLFIFMEKGIDLHSDYFYGNVLALLASFAWAVYTVIGKKIIPQYGAIYSTALAMIFGFILYIPIFLVFGDVSTFQLMQLDSWAKVAYLGVMNSVVGYALWYWMLKRMEASKLSVFNNLQPILTAALSAVLLSFAFTPIFIIGAVTVIAGVYLTQRG